VSIPFPPQKNKAFYHNNKKQSTTNKYPDFSAWRKKEQINQPLSSLHTQSIIMTHSTETYYYYVPNLQALDPTAREVDPSAYAWVQPTIIEDEDLTFGGKSLSAWYEEDRRRHSSGSSSSSSDEEERRGRERVRRNYSRSGKSHKK
jgi:hypothetical protein